MTAKENVQILGVDVGCKCEFSGHICSAQNYTKIKGKKHNHLFQPRVEGGPFSDTQTHTDTCVPKSLSKVSKFQNL